MTGPNDIQRETLSVREAAKILGISPKAAYQAAKRRQIPVIHIGGRILVIKAELEQMIGKRAASTIR